MPTLSEEDLDDLLALEITELTEEQLQNLSRVDLHALCRHYILYNTQDRATFHISLPTSFPYEITS